MFCKLNHRWRTFCIVFNFSCVHTHPFVSVNAQSCTASSYWGHLCIYHPFFIELMLRDLYRIMVVGLFYTSLNRGKCIKESNDHVQDDM